MNSGVTTAGLERLSLKFTRRINFLGGEGIREVLKLVADDLVDEYKQNIASFVPGPVPDLAESTKRSKARKVGNIYPILVASGYFLASMQGRVLAPARSGGWRVAVVFLGTHPSGGTPNAEIARAHLLGGPHLPARDFTKLSPNFRRRSVNRVRVALRSIR